MGSLSREDGGSNPVMICASPLASLASRVTWPFTDFTRVSIMTVSTTMNRMDLGREVLGPRHSPASWQVSPPRRSNPCARMPHRTESYNAQSPEGGQPGALGAAASEARKAPGAPRARVRAPCRWAPEVRRLEPLAPYEPPVQVGRDGRPGSGTYSAVVGVRTVRVGDHH